MSGNEYGVHFGGDGSVLEVIAMVAHIVNVLKATKLYTLKW